ncbi:electron transport complex protein RnfG [Rhodobium orientis]|uniref:Ion-translocating oxidoreductase complex subunit G n=1 Tax=Rhodobium orientis TaxID=34017 RepID=A0A327JIC5_9HYPH|nr:electron transport complex subunit RsxG [Rhodobium orientis]MBB4304365.1 electron transport complex protein RnfG [Rhodobium orientis]MBK5951971.1 electron transport complex subunit RsxG [Rhodobium orientis]RAI25751.1 electron transport complex subunit RsxG [Rhodobium orientis]
MARIPGSSFYEKLSRRLVRRRPPETEDTGSEAEALVEPDGAADAASSATAAGEHGSRSPIYLAALLGGFALIGAALLATGFAGTEDAIEQRHKEDLQASLSMVMPEDLHDNDPVVDAWKFSATGDNSRMIYPAIRDGEVTAIAYRVTGQGYGGAILILMGVSANGELIGVRVLQHAETPGLGDKIEAEKSAWIENFSGLSFGNTSQDDWRVKKDGGRFDQFSGATITPRAVVKAVREGLEFFASYRDALTTLPKKTSEANP